MIGLAQEIPTSMLATWSPLADLDFILAHKVLEDDAYAEFFRCRDARRELILDNSYHELGYPLELSDLLEAAERCRADYVIAPDRIGDAEHNCRMFLKAKQVLAGYGVAVVMTGADDSTPRDRDNFLVNVKHADMLCCTFKQPLRHPWYSTSHVARTHFKRVHLLGVSSLEELSLWAHTALWHPVIEFSVDTGKALKWALRGKKLDELESLRSNAETTTLGQPSEASQHILGISEEVALGADAVFRHNVEVLKRVCR